MALDDWSEGYVADLAYTVGYYRELSPSLQQFVLLQQGIAPPNTPDAEFDYFELGFGQGLSLNVNALSHPRGRFWGNDFNPQHVLFAQELGAEAGLPIRVSDDSFEELLERDFPPFDYIALHGVWSWINAQNKETIVQFIRRNLKVGGVVYISHNTLPGWASAAPLRQLIKTHESLESSIDGKRTDRIRKSLEFAQKLADTGAGYFKFNPGIGDRLKSLQTQSPSYLAHEYFNRDWTPMYFNELAQSLAGAKLTYAGSASILEHVPGLSLAPEMRKLIDEIEQPEFRETVRDYLLNTQFRRDIFIRGANRLSREECARRMETFRFTLMLPPAKVSYSVTIGARKAELQRDVYEPIIGELAAVQGGLTLQELHARPALAKMAPPTMMQAISILLGANIVAVHAGPPADEARTRALNAHLVKRAEESGDVRFLAASKAGSAALVDRFEQLFLRAAAQGKDANQAADIVWGALSARGERISKDGKPLLDAAANRAEILAHARKFYAESLTRLRDIGAVV